MSVNVSLKQFQSDRSSPTSNRPRRSGLAPDSLVLEITESLIRSTPTGLERLRQLKSLGVRLALDDFGTGYSSLSYLRRSRSTS